jgi:hypothetical protein
MKEYRNLLLAKDGTDDKATHAGVIKTLVENAICEELNEDTELSAYDYENIFLKSYQFSTGTDNINVLFKCTNETLEEDEDGEFIICDADIHAKIIIDDVKPTIVEGSENFLPSRVFQMQEGIEITIAKPTFTQLAEMNLRTTDGIATGLVECFKFININGVISNTDDIEQEDLEEIFERCSNVLINKMFMYISSSPRISYDLHLQCPNCKKQYRQTLVGLEDFFI